MGVTGKCCEYDQNARNTSQTGVAPTQCGALASQTKSLIKNNKRIIREKGPRTKQIIDTSYRTALSHTRTSCSLSRSARMWPRPMVRRIKVVALAFRASRERVACRSFDMIPEYARHIVYTWIRCCRCKSNGTEPNYCCTGGDAF